MSEFFRLATSGFWTFLGVALLVCILGWFLESVVHEICRAVTKMRRQGSD